MRILIGVMRSAFAGMDRELRVYIDISADGDGKVVCPALSVDGPFDVAAALIAEQSMSDNEVVWTSKVGFSEESFTLSSRLREAQRTPQLFSLSEV